MIRVHIPTLTAERIPVPEVLRGLDAETLADLTPFDPALGLHDYAWWPEVSGDEALPDGHRWGAEILTANPFTRTVTVAHEVVPLTQEEIDARRPKRHVTSLAFRQRFTQAEKVGIEIACLDKPSGTTAQRQQAAALRANQIDVQVATYIDLDRADTRAGVQALEAAGLLAAGRAAEILDAPIQDVERPRT